MKRITATLLASVMLASCTTAMTEIEETQEICFDITVGDLAHDGTRAMKTSWTRGDKVNVWFNGRLQQTPDLVLTYNGATWSATENNSVSFTDGNYCVAVYEGFNDLSQYTCKNGLLTAQRYPMACTCTTTYGYSQSTVTAQLSDWDFVSRVQIVVTGIDSASARNWTLSSSQFQPVQGIDVGVMKSIDAVPSVASACGVANADGVAFYFADVSFQQCSSYGFNLVKGGDTYTYHADKTLGTASDRCKGIKIAFSKFSSSGATALVVTKGTAPDGVRWVQLWDGGPKFAVKNEAAATETDFGHDYALGSTAAGWPSGHGNMYWYVPFESAYEELVLAAAGGSSLVNCAVVDNGGTLGFRFTGKGIYDLNSLFIPADRDTAGGAFVRIAAGIESYVLIKTAETDMEKVTSTSRYVRFVLR